jgi:hypothetical protein
LKINIVYVSFFAESRIALGRCLSCIDEGPARLRLAACLGTIITGFRPLGPIHAAPERVQ